VQKLKPGEKRSSDFPIKIIADADKIQVESLSEKGVIHPALQFFIFRDPKWRIPRIKPLASPAEVAKMLVAQAPRNLTILGRLLAEYRAAVAGDQFALMARISDAAPRRGEHFWKGSCIEVFTHERDQYDAPTGQKPGDQGEGIRQSFLVPAVGRTRCARRLSGGLGNQAVP